MAWNFVAHRGTINDKSGTTQIEVTPLATLAVGSVIVVRAVVDNIGSVSGETNEHSCSDSAGNSWTKLREHSMAPSAAGGVTVSLWMSRLTSSIPTSGFVRITLTTIRSAYCVSLMEFSIGGTGFSLVAADGDHFTTTTPSSSVSGLTSAPYLFLGALGWEGVAGDGFTQDADYGNNSAQATSGGGTLSNVVSHVGVRIATLTGDTYNPVMGTSRDCASILVAVQEIGGDGTLTLQSVPAIASLPNIAVAAPARVVLGAVSGLSVLPTIFVTSPWLFTASASGNAAVDNIVFAEGLLPNTVEGVASVANIVLSPILAPSAVSGTASVGNVVISTPTEAFSLRKPLGGSQLRGGHHLRASSRLYVDPILASASVDNITVVTAVSTITLQPVPGIATVGNIALVTQPQLALGAVLGVTTVGNVVLSQTLIASSSGLASLANISLSTQPILALGAVSSVASLANVSFVTTPILSLSSVSGIAIVANIKISPILNLGAVNGLSSLANVTLSATASLSLGATSGVASLANVSLRTTAVLSLGAVSGTSTVGNVQLSQTLVATAAGIATVGNVTIGATPLFATTSAGVAALGNLTLSGAALVPNATSGVASLAHIVLSAPALLDQLSAGGASLANIDLITQPYLALVPVLGVASLANIELVSARVFTLSTAGVANLANVSLVTQPYIALSPVLGLSSLINIEIAPTGTLIPSAVQGTASLANIVFAKYIPLGGVQGFASLPQIAVAAPVTIVPAPVSAFAILPNVGLVDIGYLTLDTTSGVALLANVTLVSSVNVELLASGTSSAALVLVFVLAVPIDLGASLIFDVLVGSASHVEEVTLSASV